jgi:geranylgeranyl diphosphate synthase, type II
MEATSRIEQALQGALARADVPGCPPTLAAAMQHAVFPKGARVRPRLCLAVASACGDDEPALTDAAAASIELLHCASLVHDDLPCFDNAATRRGRPSVHQAFGQPLAVLTGDALIVLAFQTLGRVTHQPQRLALLLMTVSRSVGVPFGIVAGQAWECESSVDVAHYHRSKTGALFAAAAISGAAASGAECEPWRRLGEKLGEAYQAADDICDAAGNSGTAGKPVGRDAALSRPNVVGKLGLPGAIVRLENLVGEAIEAIPQCSGAAELQSLIGLEAKRLLPKQLAQHAA